VSDQQQQAGLVGGSTAPGPAAPGPGAGAPTSPPPLAAHEGAAAGLPAGMDAVAGPVGLGVSVVVGAVVLLDRLGFLPARQSTAAPAAQPATAPPVDLLAKMASLETRIGTIETTVAGMDARDRQDAVVLGRLAEKVEGLGDHLGRIEAALDAMRRDGRDGHARSDGHGARR